MTGHTPWREIKHKRDRGNAARSTLALVVLDPGPKTDELINLVAEKLEAIVTRDEALIELDVEMAQPLARSRAIATLVRAGGRRNRLLIL